jgi:hypothetical protein
LEYGFELSPKVSQLVLEKAKGILLSGVGVVPGKRRIVGVEDREYESNQGRVSLRQMRILRVIEEGIDHGVVFSEEDLGKLFGISVRAIKRDIQSLRRASCVVNTRGYVRGIGRAIGHKRLIVELYLQGKTYGELETRTRHSHQAIRRY